MVDAQLDRAAEHCAGTFGVARRSEYTGSCELHRAEADELALCEEQALAFVPFFPLGSAFAGGPKQLAADPVIAEVATRRRATPSQIALAWLLARSERILLIPGTSSIQHLEENIAAGDVELDEHDMQTLESAIQLGDPRAAAEH